MLRSMFSLRQILAQHSPVLLIDSSSTLIQVGLWTNAQAVAWEAAEREAGTGVFASTENLLQAAGVSLTQIEAFIFCAGPGSVLGIRTAAAAIRIWNTLRPRPVFSFTSLELVAHFEKTKRAGSAFSVIADARRETWHQIQVDERANISPLRRVPATALTGTLLTPTFFRHWAPLPPAVENVSYHTGAMLETLNDAPLFSENLDPDAFLHEAPSYLTWTPQIHRAPSTS